MKFLTFTLPTLVFVFSTLSYAEDNLAKVISTQSPKGLFFEQFEPLSMADTKEHLSIIAVGDVLLHKPLHIQALKNP